MCPASALAGCPVVTGIGRVPQSWFVLAEIVGCRCGAVEHEVAEAFEFAAAAKVQQFVLVRGKQRDRLLSKSSKSLRNHVADHPAFHIGETEVAAVVAERQAFVFEAQKMQDGGVQVVNVNFIDDRFIVGVDLGSWIE